MVEYELKSSILSCKTSYKFALKDPETGEIQQFVIGPGMAQLLHGVEKYGSLRQAAADMGMSYSKAWTHLRRSEKVCGVKLTERSIGGAEGGGSRLTEEGKWLLAAYDSFVQEADRSVKKLMAKHFTRDIPMGEREKR